MKYRIVQTNRDLFMPQVRTFGVWLNLKSYANLKWGMDEYGFAKTYCRKEEAEQSLKKFFNEIRILRKKRKVIVSGDLEDKVFLDSI